jgi:hypothetical protein
MLSNKIAANDQAWRIAVIAFPLPELLLNFLFKVQDKIFC